METLRLHRSITFKSPSIWSWAGRDKERRMGSAVISRVFKNATQASQIAACIQNLINFAFNGGIWGNLKFGRVEWTLWAQFNQFTCFQNLNRVKCQCITTQSALTSKKIINIFSHVHDKLTKYPVIYVHIVWICRPTHKSFCIMIFSHRIKYHSVWYVMCHLGVSLHYPYVQRRTFIFSAN